LRPSSSGTFSQKGEPVTTANARIGPATLDGAAPFGRPFSFQKTADAQPPRR
jgi:hypothetical protein